MIGEVVGQYRIVEELGAGGMGVVYRAEDTKLGRSAALKFLPETMATDPKALERFRREARAASSLNHPNICTIYDIDDHDGRPFIAMELLEGQTLWEKIQSGPLPLEEWVRIGRQVAEALDAAHGAGMIHRDIKPANLFLTSRGQAKVLDFGLAKQAEDDGPAPGTAMPTASAGGPPLTREGATIGTIAYMSPEQARGEELDGRSDLFSLGAVLYEMATGRPAFQGNTTAVVFDSILRGAPAPAVHSRPDAPPEMVRIIEKALEKDRQVRYQTAAELVADLRRLRRDSEASQVGVTPAGGVTAAVPAKRGGSGLRIVVGLALVALAIAVGYLFLGRDDRDSLAPAVDATSGSVTIAVLPFENFGAGDDQQYLALAVPDEIATALTHVDSLAVRPFAMSRKYRGEAADLALAARDLGVGHVVTGHFTKEGDDLRVSLETIDAGGNRVVWKDGVTVPPGNMIALREALAGKVSGGLLPALGLGSRAASGTLPASEEAYGLYLRSVALGPEGEANRQAIEMLERVVDLDPGYAPAWAALAERYYDEGQYVTDVPDEVADYARKARMAARRAVELDPDLPTAVWPDVVLRVELGETAQAFDQARAFLERNPRNSLAHFNLGYVYRYAGLLEKSAQACERALQLDPTNPSLRSCGITYMFLGDAERAEHFYSLDPDSTFTYLNTVMLLLTQDRVEEAQALVRERSVEPGLGISMSERCVLGATPEEIAENAPHEVRLTVASRDSESIYGLSQRLAGCGLIDLALDNLQRAVDSGYCGYPYMAEDPLLAPVRDDPRFEQALQSGRACREAFEAHLDRVGAR